MKQHVRQFSVKSLLAASIIILLISCKGEVGPQGPVGQSAIQPTIYDFTIDLSAALPSYTLPKAVDANDVIFAYIMTNRGSGYSPLPFKGYAFTSDQKNSVNLDVSFSSYTGLVAFDNKTAVSSGATFLIRLVVVKASKGGRLGIMSNY